MKIGIGIGMCNGGGAIDPFNGAMVFDIVTTAPDEVFTALCQNVGTFNAVMDHGDDSTSNIVAYNDVLLAHTYSTPGTYRISITGSFPSLFYNSSGDVGKIKEFLNIGDTDLHTLVLNGAVNMTAFTAGATAITPSLSQMISVVRGCSVATIADFRGMDTVGSNAWGSLCRSNPLMTTVCVDGLDTSIALNMDFTFAALPSLTSLTGVESWDIESVTSFTSFAAGTTIPTATYDAILASWAAQTFATNPLASTIDFGGSTYSASSTAARATVAANFLTFTDGGLAP